MGFSCTSFLHIDEIARPQALVLVREHRLEPHGRGGLVDRNVDQEKLAGRELAAVRLIEGHDLDLASRHRVAHIVERARW